MNLGDILFKLFANPSFWIWVVAVILFLMVFFIIIKPIQARNKFDKRIDLVNQENQRLRLWFLKGRQDLLQQGSDGLFLTIAKAINIDRTEIFLKVKDLFYAAGIRNQNYVLVYLLVKYLASLFFLLIALKNFLILGFGFQTIMFLFIGIVCYIFPDIRLNSEKENRYANVRRTLPDAVDLMLICVESGISIENSIKRVIKELIALKDNAYATLIEELSFLESELSYLTDPKQAYQHLIDRLDIPEVRSFIVIIVQSEKYGTSVSQGLKIVAQELRNKRVLDAEERAAKIPTKMTAVMMIFILPLIISLFLAPTIIHQYYVFMSGGEVENFSYRVSPDNLQPLPFSQQ